MNEWQTMETAPRDGTMVLLWSAVWEMSWGVTVGRFADGKWECAEGTVGEDEINDELGPEDEPVLIGPTHWHAIPTPPYDEDDE